MAWAEINGIRMYYESHGEGEQAIIFAHGAGGNHLSWWQQVPHFRDRYRCVVFDHRGFGRTNEAEGAPGARMFPDDLLALMDTLGINRAFLVAQSMGGRACMGVTVANPERVRGLVMADTTGTMNEAVLNQKRKEYQDSQPPNQPLAGRAYNPDLKRRNPALAFLYDSVMALNPRREPPPADAPDREERHDATGEKLAALKVPVQFIVGSNDIIVTPEIIKHAASLIPGARYAEVPVSGHSVYFEEADAFNRILDDFFAAVEQAEKQQPATA